MYWQGYLHKTVISAENMLIQVLKRAKKLMTDGKQIYATSSLSVFLKNNYLYDDFISQPQLLDDFSQLDDFEISVCLKHWRNNNDFVLSNLSERIINRKLLKIRIQNLKFKPSEVNNLLDKMQKKYKITKQDAEYFIFSDKVSNNTYNIEKSKINILMKNGDVIDITTASDQFNIDVLSRKVKKYFLCYPKSIL